MFLRPSSEVANTAGYYGIDFPYDDPTVPYSWDALKIQLNPGNLSDTEFDAAYAQFTQSIGPQTGDFLKMLSAMSFVVPNSTTDAFETVRALTQEAFDRFLSQRTASIAGHVQYNDFNIDFAALTVTATNTDTFESYSAVSDMMVSLPCPILVLVLFN